MNLRQIARKLAPVVYKDEQFLFVNKPAGLPSAGGVKGRAPEWLGAVAGEGEWLPIYGLPVMQSGVLGFAKSLAAQRHLATGISTGSVQSTFVAVVQGRVKRQEAVISAGLRRVGKDRFVADRTATGTDLPSTRIETVARGETLALVRCRLNGLDERQVRAHLQAAYLRLVGDLGSRMAREKRGARMSPEPRSSAGKPPASQTVPLMLHLEEVRFHHPGLKRAVAIRAPVPVEFREAVSVEGRRGGVEAGLVLRLRAGLAKRMPCFLDDETDAFRVLHGPADGVTGLAADLYGEVLILQVLQGKFQSTFEGKAEASRVEGVARWYHRLLDLRAVHVKHFTKDRSREAQTSEGRGPLFDPQPLVGDPVEAQFVVREAGLQFLVRPYDGYSTGLFLEQRENRRRVRELASDRLVLNLFAYTCGFSVAAAAGGATQTVSVDASRRHLEWGKENFQLNDLSLDGQLFIHDDAFNYFKRARRQGVSFDLMIIDPPSFARIKKPRRVFTIAKDLRELLTEAMTVLDPGGIMLVCTNQRELGRSWLREQIILAAGERRVAALATPELPIDFAGDPDYSKSVLVRVS